ncbi:MAG: ribosomal protein S18-alanine N-acetyltransferase [Pseudomonadota bacterium]
MSVAGRTFEVSVRRMTHNDLHAVSEIERQSYGFPWSSGIFRDCLLAGYHCMVLDSDREIRAYGILSVAAGEAHVLNICVAAAFRRQGYGVRLLHALIDQARKSRVKRVFLEVRPSNLSATSMYKGIGFTTVGRRVGYYKAANDTREDALVLGLDL